MAIPEKSFWQNIKEFINEMIDAFSEALRKIVFILILTMILFNITNHFYRYNARREIAKEAERIAEACHNIGLDTTYKIDVFTLGGLPDIRFLCDWSNEK